MKRRFIILALSFAFAIGMSALTSAPLTRDGWLQLTAPFANNFAVIPAAWRYSPRSAAG
jgi:hypothetical protein